MNDQPQNDQYAFITRRFVAPPTPVSDILTTVLAVFLATLIAAIIFILLPSPSHSASNYENTSYEYYPPEDKLFSIVAHSKKSTDGHITYHSATWTFDKTSQTLYRLEQILRDPVAVSQLIQQPITAADLKASFAIDRANQELVLGLLDSPEQRISFADLEGKLSYEFSQPMFGVNPFAYKNPDNTDCKVAKCLALTFDDGPSEHTDRLLDILDYTHAKATFFVLGHRVNAFAGQIARIAREGHDVGSHSWIHRNLPRFSYSQILNDLTVTTNTIQPVSGQRVRFFRPPYGALNNNVRNAIAALGQQSVLWTIDPWDWQNKDVSFVCNDVVDYAHPGGIILLHDIYGTSVDATECIINRLSAEYTFVNLTTLLR